MVKMNPRTFRLDDAALAAVNAIAEAEGRSFGDVVRRLVAEALAARENRKDGS